MSKLKSFLFFARKQDQIFETLFSSRNPLFPARKERSAEMTTLTDQELFTHANLVNGKVVLITGGSNGIGRVSPHIRSRFRHFSIFSFASSLVGIGSLLTYLVYFKYRKQPSHLPKMEQRLSLEMLICWRQKKWSRTVAKSAGK